MTVAPWPSVDNSTYKHCGAHVTDHFSRVFGDNRNQAHRCGDCDTYMRLSHGSAAGAGVSIPDRKRRPAATAVRPMCSWFVPANRLSDVGSRTPIAHPTHQATDVAVRRALENRAVRADGGYPPSGTERQPNSAGDCDGKELHLRHTRGSGACYATPPPRRLQSICSQSSPYTSGRFSLSDFMRLLAPFGLIVLSGTVLLSLRPQRE